MIDDAVWNFVPILYFHAIFSVKILRFGIPAQTVKRGVLGIRFLMKYRSFALVRIIEP